MKTLILSILLLAVRTAFAQSRDETELLKLSAALFRWEVENKTDSIANMLDEKLIVLNSAGQTQDKTAYLTRIKGGSFVHNAVNVEQSSAGISDNTGTVTGKGKFTVTVNGKQSVIYLTYLEVFIRPSARSPWKLMALHASVIPD